MSETTLVPSQQQRDALVDKLIHAHAPGIEGADILVAEHPEMLDMMHNIAVPGHEGVIGRIGGIQDSKEHGRLVALHWKTEKDGQPVDAVRAFKLEDVLEANPSPEVEYIDPTVQPVQTEEVEDIAVQTAPEAQEDTFQPRESRMQELREKYRLEDSTSADQLSRVVAERVEKIRPVQQALSEMGDLRQHINEINETLSGRGIIYLSARHQRELQDFIDGPGHKALLEALDDPLLKDAQHARHLKAVYDGLFISPTQLTSMEQLGDVVQILQRLQPLQQRLPHEVLSLEHELAEVVGYAEAQRVIHEGEEQEPSEFRNEQIAQWVEQIRSAKTPEQFEEAVAAMEVTVGIEAKMVDDPHSPSRWFSKSVQENEHKTRAAKPSVLESGGTTYAHRYVAELMANFVAGKFDTRGVLDAIEIQRSTNTVTLGYHRAAALAMLYGKNWQEHAKDYGQPIEYT